MIRSAQFWSGLYLLLVSAPLLLLMLAGDTPDGIGLWWDFAIALGFSGIAIMGLQFALTARFRRTSAPFGVDILYYFHRLVALAGLGLLAGHFAILRAGWPDVLDPLNPLDAPFYMTAGRAALLLFALVIVSSLWRKPLRIEYRRWRIAHAVLATAAFLLAVIHIEGAGYYSQAAQTRWLWLGYTLFWVLLIAYVRLYRPWSIMRRPWRVAGVRPERGRATTLIVEPQGHTGLRFHPGQFAWLTVGESPFRFSEHPFSIASSAERDDGRLEFTIKARGDFTRTVPSIPPGTKAWVDGPYGVFTPDRHREAPGLVFLAGGIGITPIISMLRTLADRGDPRPLWLFNADSTWDDVTFREEIDTLAKRIDLTVVHAIERPPPDWQGAHGRITRELLEVSLPQGYRQMQFFLCGPKPMVTAVTAMLDALGVPSARIHYELFEMV
jgi:predicted ferric reductase